MNFFNNRRPQRQNIVFESVRLNGLNKEGVIRPDKDGCYTQCIGGLNAYNSNGDFYELNAGRQFFQEQSSFQRRIARGVLRAEYGHPKREIGMSEYEYGARILNIHEHYICGTWRRIWLSPDPLKDDQGRLIIPIMGTIFPSGPYGNALREAFETRGEQVCFSIRSFTSDTPTANGTYIKRLEQIVTFDYVNEPGIYNAEKLLSPTLESLEERRFNPEVLQQSIHSLKSTSMESSGDYSDFEKKLKHMSTDDVSTRVRSNAIKWGL